MLDGLNRFCPICGVDIGDRPKYCSRKCSVKSYQKTRPASDTHRYYSKSPRHFFQSLLQKKTKDRGLISIDFLLTVWNKQKGLCALSGVPMTHIRGSGKVPTNVSIDRIDSSLGYTEDNIQLLCHRVNLMKMEHSADDLKFWCEAILRQQH